MEGNILETFLKTKISTGPLIAKYTVDAPLLLSLHIETNFCKPHTESTLLLYSNTCTPPLLISLSSLQFFCLVCHFYPLHYLAFFTLGKRSAHFGLGQIFKSSVPTL